jgi:hypothetical protein
MKKLASFALTILLSVFLLSTCNKLEQEMLVSTGGVSNILANSADVTGTVVDLGEGASQHGHCYNTSPNVNVSMNKTQLGPPAGAGGFTSNLEG